MATAHSFFHSFTHCTHKCVRFVGCVLVISPGRFNQLGVKSFHNPGQAVFTLDHNVQDTSGSYATCTPSSCLRLPPCQLSLTLNCRAQPTCQHTEKNLEKYRSIEEFAQRHNVTFFPAGAAHHMLAWVHVDCAHSFTHPHAASIPLPPPIPFCCSALTQRPWHWTPGDVRGGLCVSQSHGCGKRQPFKHVSPPSQQHPTALPHLGCLCRDALFLTPSSTSSSPASLLCCCAIAIYK